MGDGDRVGLVVDVWVVYGGVGIGWGGEGVGWG